MYKQAKQDLIQAKALIENPKHWTRKAYARDAEGRGTTPTNPSACSFCASGAMVKAVANTSDGVGRNDDERESVAGNLLILTAMEMEGCTLVDLNDDFSHDYVMAAYDKAITMAESATMTIDELRDAKVTGIRKLGGLQQ